jgi:bifunctional DNA-binding transcriptional regulator/antitoxin component of YhaV-PrlF toxin-antitoxin module
MTTQLSTRGNVPLPSAIRKHLRLRAGTTFRIHTVGGYIVLLPKRRRKYRTKIGVSPLSGLPVVMSDPRAPKITSEVVKMLLGDYC